MENALSQDRPSIKERSKWPQNVSSFTQTLASRQLSIKRTAVETVQINIGKLCNLACRHCHVESSPKKTRENMNSDAIDRIITLIDNSSQVKTVDITGGAPELNPNFRRFVKAIKNLDRNLEIIDRCNLAVFDEPGQEDMPEFLAANDVTVVASLPCYSAANVEKQRGDGVFSSSIEALQRLNSLDYARHADKRLNLVFNPGGASLPPDQKTLEDDYRRRLKDDFDITFNALFTITNMPIKRFLWDLQVKGEYQSYMELLSKSFNSSAVSEVMCAHMVSISWDGKLFDCDFNQALELPVHSNMKDIWSVETFDDFTNKVVVGNHCYGCTAGAGSSCGGTLA
jgi:radical SAM/Cys-rich protein